MGIGIESMRPADGIRSQCDEGEPDCREFVEVLRPRFHTGIRDHEDRAHRHPHAPSIERVGNRWSQQQPFDIRGRQPIGRWLQGSRDR